MGQVNYMGGRLNTVKTRNKDTTLQIRKKHFGKQRLKTLSDYLQAINNPVSRVNPDPISRIDLGHARFGVGGVLRREPGSDSGLFGQQRYRSYIPAPSKVSSESSDSLDAGRASDAKLSTRGILRELARVEPASLDYQRKRLLEMPDFAGLAARKQRIEAAANFSNRGSQTASAYGNDEDDSMVVDYHDTISEYSSFFRDFSEASWESIHSWSDERNIPKNKLSPSSSIRSFPSGSHGATSPILSERYSDPNQAFPGSDASVEGNVRTEAEDYAAQIYTSDSLIMSSKKRKPGRSLISPGATCDPLDIIMSDEWLAFSKMLDATLYSQPSSGLSKFPHVPGINSCKETCPLIRSDMPLGLDFYMLPHLSERLSQQNDTVTSPSEPIRPPASHDEKSSSAAVTEQTDEHTTVQSDNQNMHSIPDPNPSYPAVTSIRRRMKLDDAKLPTHAEADDYALSDITSILLSRASASSDVRLDSRSSNSDLVQSHTDGSDMDYKRGSRSQWDELMQDLLGPAPLPERTKTARVFESNSNTTSSNSDSNSHIAVRSSDLRTLPASPSESSLRLPKTSSSDDPIPGETGNVLQTAENHVEAKSIASLLGSDSDLRNPKSSRNVNGDSTTPETETISGPILFAFTFTSDREDEDEG